MTVAELLDLPEKWCKGAEARDAAGQPVRFDSTQAVAWCLTGAVSKAYPYSQGQEIIDGGWKGWEILDRLARQAESAVTWPVGQWPRPSNAQVAVRFNDEPSTTFADIRRVVEAAGV